MCFGPVLDEELEYLCMAPSVSLCYCGLCDKWYTCESHKTCINNLHIKKFGKPAKWRGIYLASGEIK